MRKTFLVTRYVFYSVCTFLSSIQENSPSSQTVPSCDENQPKTTCEDLNIMLSYDVGVKRYFDPMIPTNCPALCTPAILKQMIIVYENLFEIANHFFRYQFPISHYHPQVNNNILVSPCKLASVSLEPTPESCLQRNQKKSRKFNISRTSPYNLLSKTSD